MCSYILNTRFELFKLAFNLSEARGDLPLVDELWVDLERPDETGEHLDGPGVAEDVLHIWHVHTELVAESLLYIEGNLT